MKAQISFAEIEEIIRNKASKNVGFSYVSSDTVRVSTTYEKDTFLTKIKIPLNVDVRLIKIEGSDIVLEYSIGEKIDKIAGLKIIGKIVDRFIRGKKMEDLVTFDSSNRMRIIVHLGKYDKVTKALEIVEIKDVRFISNFVEIEFKVDLKQK